MNIKTIATHSAAFVAGAAAGVGAAYLIGKKKYYILDKSKYEIATNDYEDQILLNKDWRNTDGAKEGKDDPYPAEIVDGPHYEAIEEDDPAEVYNCTPLGKDSQVDYTKYYESSNDDLIETSSLEVPDIAESEEEEDEEEVTVIEEPKKPEIYAIPEEEFGQEEGFDTITFMLTADGVIIDEDESVVNIADADKLLGKEVVPYFKSEECKDDSIYIRNEFVRADYELLKSARLYYEIAQEKNKRYGISE